jgi:hypothetical protein
LAADARLVAKLWEALLPWTASLLTGDIEQRAACRRATMIFAARALPPGLFDPVVYYVIIRAWSKRCGACSTSARRGGVVTGDRPHISREPHGQFTLRCVDGSSFTVDDLVRFVRSGHANF